MEKRAQSAGAYVLSREAAREIDRIASEEFGLPTIVLMENAARALADVTLRVLGANRDGLVAVFCGRGNNGGDGFAAARHLANAGARVCCVAETAVHETSGDAGINARVAAAMDIAILNELDGEPPSVIVDALLGTGIRGVVSGRSAEFIAAINGWRERGAKVVAADLPSGMDCDTGLPLGAAVRADVTVTFAGVKQGLLEAGAGAYAGEIVVGDIGVPYVVLERVGVWKAGLDG